jgi:hypothetical protein
MIEEPDELGHPTDTDPRSDELDADRIDRIARMRQALGRSRSHAVALALITAVLAAQLLFNLVRHLLAQGLTGRAALFALGATLLATITTIAIRRARAISRELRQPLHHPPPQQPDFSTLSNGTQRWQNLDRM